jgi:SAM-dependent methyltransferase
MAGHAHELPHLHAEGIASNRELWDAWTTAHVGSEFYDVDGFVADPAARPFDSIVSGVLGDVAGKRVLHLQCHFGLDTIRLALAGAEVTGVDFSIEGVVAARALAERMGVDARFVQGDVLALPDEIERGTFDVVFASYGVLGWLPDLSPWAESIATRLVPGGRVVLVELHPFAWVFDEVSEEPPLTLRYPYFTREAMVGTMQGSYAAPDSDVTGTSYEWMHTFEEILGVLLERGLAIESLHEYPLLAWQGFPFMVPAGEPGFWKLPEGEGDIPLMFSLTARKPG